MFHFFGEHSVPVNRISDISNSFSVSMLPWGIAFMMLNALIGMFWGKVKQADAEKSKVITELQEALAKVKTLSGFLPICAACKKIRDDHGYCNQIETYIRKHSEVEFSHSICPGCAQKMYPEIYKDN